MDDNTLSGKMAKEVFRRCTDRQGRFGHLKDRGLLQIRDSGEISAVVDEALGPKTLSGCRFLGGQRASPSDSWCDRL